MDEVDTPKELRLVTWVDAAHTDGWVDPDEAEFAEFGVSICRCVGFVIRESDDEVLLAQSVDDRHGRIDSVMAIPKVAITGSVTLKAGPGLHVDGRVVGWADPDGGYDPEGWPDPSRDNARR